MTYSTLFHNLYNYLSCFEAGISSDVTGLVVWLRLLPPELGFLGGVQKRVMRFYARCLIRRRVRSVNAFTLRSISQSSKAYSREFPDPRGSLNYIKHSV